MNQPFTARRWRNAACLVLLAGLLMSGACGTPGATEEPAQRSRERAEYDRIYGEWKVFLDELRQLKKEYAYAEPGRQPELKERYNQMIKKGLVLEAALLDAAVTACFKRPEENKDLADFLMQAVRVHIFHEEYEEALRLAQLLIDSRVCEYINDYSMYFCAVIAGCAVGEEYFSLAEKHLQFLDRNQIRLSGRKNPYQPIIDECRRDLPHYKKAWERERKLRDQEARAGDLPRVLLRTNKGDIELELFENEAPNTVANFVSLVEKGFYDGLTFHRVLPGFMAQGGCPNGNGTGGPTYASADGPKPYTIACECYRPDHRLHFRGSLSMAHRGQRDSGGSQFFITFRPVRQLDGKHTVFGRVVRGIDVLSRLQYRQPPENPMEEQFMPLPKADQILEAKVLRKRNHPYDPKIIPEKEPQFSPQGVDPALTRSDRHATAQNRFAALG